MIFDKCELEFQRKIFCASEFFFLSKKDPDEKAPEWITGLIENPVIEKSGEISKYIYFIMKGQIHIMNKNGMYEYGIIQECGYFGDISILLNQPSEYAYYNNNDSDIAMLTLDAK